MDMRSAPDIGIAEDEKNFIELYAYIFGSRLGRFRFESHLPDYERIRAIVNMPSPVDVQALRLFLRVLPRAKRQEVKKDVIRKFRLHYRTTSPPMLDDKPPVEILMEITVQAINPGMIPKNKTSAWIGLNLGDSSSPVTSLPSVSIPHTFNVTITKHTVTRSLIVSPVTDENSKYTILTRSAPFLTRLSVCKKTVG
nr:hypothetical protein HmN_000985400 [Hymenolepis microstoma]